MVTEGDMQERAKHLVSISIYLHGVGLDPVVATQMFGVNPVEARATGERRTLRSGAEVVAKGGLWVYSLKSDQEEIPALLAKFRNDIKIGLQNLQSIGGLEEVYVDFYIASSVWQKSGTNVSFEIPSEFLEEISRSGCSIQFSHSVTFE